MILKGQVMLGAHQILLQDRAWEKHHRFSLTSRGIKEMEEFVWEFLNTWRSAKVQNQGRCSMRFADPDMNLKKTFELHLLKDVPRLVHQCRGNCGMLITEDCFLVVKSLGTSRWTDTNGNERSKFGLMYLHFEKNIPSKLWLRKSLWTFSKFWLQSHNRWQEM